MRILQKTHGTHTIPILEKYLSEFEGKYPKFIFTGIHYLSLVYFLQTLVMKLSKMKSVEHGSTHRKTFGCCEFHFILLCPFIELTHRSPQHHGIT